MRNSMSEMMDERHNLNVLTHEQADYIVRFECDQKRKILILLNNAVWNNVDCTCALFY